MSGMMWVVAKPSQAVPMDINSVLASFGFTWPVWRKACSDRKTCFRCLQPFDKDHEWGGRLREEDQDFERSSYRSIGDSADKGKKRESISELDSIHAPKKQLSSFHSTSAPVPPVQLTSAHVDLISAEPMSLSEIMFNRQLSELEYDELDLGASTSSIESDFASLHHLRMHLLPSPLALRSFDGSAAVTGDMDTSDCHHPPDLAPNATNPDPWARERIVFNTDAASELVEFVDCMRAEYHEKMEKIPGYVPWLTYFKNNQEQQANYPLLHG
ncbi:hypothetical protein PGT21_017975 [Puccinia graminis f. sp. tritici]|uniref:Uncharacterized protein n=1 Tax=Puccinia graminis f. sp. tritici TaxID=56615 RepID=A0A5B0LZC5_PUCGR|nr:hypothetical protein PGT21_017975 [Puccinia graminis f. sp. tritici]